MRQAEPRRSEPPAFFGEGGRNTFLAWPEDPASFGPWPECPMLLGSVSRCIMSVLSWSSKKPIDRTLCTKSVDRYAACQLRENQACVNSSQLAMNGKQGIHRSQSKGNTRQPLSINLANMRGASPTLSQAALILSRKYARRVSYIVTGR